MIYTLYVNPTIDKTMYLRSFAYGKTNRSHRVSEDGAGKAINAAVVLKELGHSVQVIGISYADGGIIKERLKKHGIPYDFAEAKGKSRVNVKLFDEEKQTITEINEPGSRPDEKCLRAAAAKMYGRAAAGDTVILTGSLPEGCGAYFYREMIQELKPGGVRCVLDASGEALRQGVLAGPYFIKPNRDEMCELAGLPRADTETLAGLAREYAAGGIRYVMVSLGPEGAILTDGAQTFFAGAPRVRVRSTVGAGDSMLAASAVLLDNGMEAALQSGVAAAAASILREGTQLMNMEEYRALLEQVQVKKI